MQNFQSIIIIRARTYGEVWLYIIIMSRTRFRVNAHSIVGLNVMELPGQSRAHIWSWSGSNEIRTHINLVRKPNQSVLGPNTIAPTWRSFLICISVPLNLKLTNQRLTLLGVRVHMGAWFFWITIDLSSPLLHSKFFH